MPERVAPQGRPPGIGPRMLAKLGIPLPGNQIDGTGCRHDDKPAGQVDVGRDAPGDGAQHETGGDRQDVEDDHAPQPQRIARCQREIAAGDRAQTRCDRSRGSDTDERQCRGEEESRAR